MIDDADEWCFEFTNSEGYWWRPLYPKTYTLEEGVRLLHGTRVVAVVCIRLVNVVTGEIIHPVII